MEKQEERWFIRSQEHTLGPFTAAEIEAGLKSGELLFDDKICLSQKGIWQPLRSYPRFAPLAPPEKGSASLELLPPVSALWKKKREPYSPPVAPTLPKEEAAAIPPESLPSGIASTAPATPAPQAAAEPRRVYREDDFPDPRHVALSLKTALREWAREEAQAEARRKPAYELPAAPPPDFSAPAPAATESRLHRAAPPPPEERIFIPEPRPRSPAPKATASESVTKVIRIELKFPRLGRAFLFLFLLGLAAAAYFAWPYKNKMRDLKGFHLSDPSSPTTEPSTESDPIPPLKAPTRPQRE